jgi:hypothetical protein
MADHTGVRFDRGGFVGISPTDGTGMASNERDERRTRKE